MKEIKNMLYKAKKIACKYKNTPLKNIHKEYSEIRPQLLKERTSKGMFFYGRVHALEAVNRLKIGGKK